MTAQPPVPAEQPTGSLESHPATRLVIEPPHAWQALDLAEIWRYRELLYFLVWRDVKVRYKQTLIGVAWVVLQPFLSMVIFTVIFGQLMHVQTSGDPYPIFSFAALLPWTFFSGALGRASASLVADTNLISKVYFPRLIVPLAAVSSMLVDFAVSFVILIGLMAFYGKVPGLGVLALPLLVLLAFLTALGCSLWLSALNVRYRDFAYLVPFLIQFWFFVTPIVYSSAIIPARWRPLYALNPMAGVTEGFRWALLGQQGWPGTSMILSTGIALLVFVGGLYYFRQTENQFADVI